jgi:DNA-binding response OmpR family regulator
LPDIDGLTLFKNVKQLEVNIPVLVLTLQDLIEDKIKELDQDPDDYLSKPFDANELITRLLVIKRRLGAATNSTITIGEVYLD